MHATSGERRLLLWPRRTNPRHQSRGAIMNQARGALNLAQQPVLYCTGPWHRYPVLLAVLLALTRPVPAGPEPRAHRGVIRGGV